MLRTLLLLGVLGGCAGIDVKPFDPTPVSEIPEGPGLFSGKEGKFQILRK